MKTKVKEIDKKITKLFEALETEINKRSEVTLEHELNYLRGMTEYVINAISEFEKIRIR